MMIFLVFFMLLSAVIVFVFCFATCVFFIFNEKDVEKLRKGFSFYFAVGLFFLFFLWVVREVFVYRFCLNGYVEGNVFTELFIGENDIFVKEWEVGTPDGRKLILVGSPNGCPDGREGEVKMYFLLPKNYRENEHFFYVGGCPKEVTASLDVKK